LKPERPDKLFFDLNLPLHATEEISDCVWNELEVFTKKEVSNREKAPELLDPEDIT
jgi:hypothetical protein